MLLKIGNRKISCTIKYKKIKHAYLKVKPDYKLEIILPKSKVLTPEELITEKENWIVKKLRELEASTKLVGSDWIYYKGKKYKIKIIKDKNQRVEVSNGFIKIYKFGKRKVENLLMEFLKEETSKYVLKKAKEFSSKLNLCPKEILIKNMKSFGYCTKDKKIFFNSKLICLSPRLIDYVVCHEIIHLRHFNHSKKFKLELEKCFPDYRKLRRELKTYFW